MIDAANKLLYTSTHQGAYMDWYPEELDIPIRKPKELLRLERIDPAEIEAMTPEEIKIHVRQTANSLAANYCEDVGGDYDQCVLIVSTALHHSGKDIGGRLGNHMLAKSMEEARLACGALYSEEEF